jgi:hypothetical protein
MTDASEEDWKLFAATDAAVIAQNVYLFCAAKAWRPSCVDWG